MKSNRIFYAFLFILSLIFVYSYGGRAAYAYLYTVLFLPVLSFSYLLILYRSFKYTLHIDGKVIMKGDTVNLTVAADNKSILFYPLIQLNFNDVKLSGAAQQASGKFFLSPFSKGSFMFQAECKYRGRYFIGIDTVIFVDFLGIFKLTRKKEATIPITVFPKVIFLEAPNPVNDFSSHALPLSRQYDEDMVMISDIRNYVYGDPVKRVHWKLSAKRGDILVKNYEKTMEAQTLILLDVKKNDFSYLKRIQIEDRVIEAAAALVHLSLASQTPIQLKYCTDEIKTCSARDLGSFEKIHRLLAEVEFSGGAELCSLLEETVKSSKQFNTIILITSNLDSRLCQGLLGAKTAGFNPFLVFVTNESGWEKEREEALLASVRKNGMKAIAVREEDELKEVYEKQAV